MNVEKVINDNVRRNFKILNLLKTFKKYYNFKLNLVEKLFSSRDFLVMKSSEKRKANDENLRSQRVVCRNLRR